MGVCVCVCVCVKQSHLFSSGEGLFVCAVNQNTSSVV